MFNQDACKLTASGVESILPPPTVVNGDFILQALLRAIVLEKVPESRTNFDLLGRLSTISVLDLQFIDFEKDFVLAHMEMSAITILAKPAKHETLLQNWETFDKRGFELNKYLSQFGDTRVYRDSERRKVVICVDEFKPYWGQAVCSVLFNLLAWYYPEPTEEETEFYRSIAYSKESPSHVDEIFTYCDMIADRYVDFRSVLIAEAARKAANGAVDRMRDSARRERRALEDKVERYTSLLREVYEDLEGAIAKMQALEHFDNKELADEASQFFLEHKDVESIDTDGNDCLRILIATTLEYFDDEAFDIDVINNPNSYVARIFENDHALKDAMSAILVDRTAVVKMSAQFSLSGWAMISPVADVYNGDWCPNPHIVNHACSGGNQRWYEKYAQEGNWQLAVEQAISATKNLNVADAVVTKEFVRWFPNHEDVKCIYVRDDLSPVGDIDDECHLISYKELLERIKDHE